MQQETRHAKFCGMKKFLSTNSRKVSSIYVKVGGHDVFNKASILLRASTVSKTRNVFLVLSLLFGAICDFFHFVYKS